MKPRGVVINQAYEQAQKRVAEASEDPSLIPRSEAQAQQVLGTFLGSLGWRVMFRWKR